VAPNSVRIKVDGQPLTVAVGTSVAAALMSAGRLRFHSALSGGGRGPLCGMGTCFECVVTVDARPGVRSCLRECVEGMEVVTDDPPA
jgi:predicted molibdopterin-dependent oxidoreductase YjgC